MAGASILCGTVLTPDSHRTVDLAIAAAKAFGVRLDLVHVLDDSDSWWPEAPELQEATAAAREDASRYEAALEAKLQEERQRCVRAGVECDAFVIRGRPWQMISEAAEERGSFLIAIGAYGSEGPRKVDARGVTQSLLGSTAERVINSADRPVFVSTGEKPIPEGLLHTRWMVGTDFSEPSLAAVTWAKRAVARVDGELHLANVVIPAGGEDKPDEERTWRQVLRDQSKIEAGKKLAEYGQQHAPNAQTHQVLSADYPAHALCAAAQEIPADIMVVGIHRRTTLGRLLLGSTASKCLRVAPVPVLLVPEPAG